MSIIKKIGFVAMSLLWLGLCFLVVDLNGFNLKNLIICVFSGLFVFLPILKKYKNK